MQNAACFVNEGATRLGLGRTGPPPLTVINNLFT